MATLTERLRSAQQVIASRGGFGGSVGVIAEAVKALESGADVGDLLEKVERLIEERDEALDQVEALQEEVRELREELDQLRE